MDGLDTRDYEDVVAKVIEEIQRGVHLEQHGSTCRWDFVLCGLVCMLVRVVSNLYLNMSSYMYMYIPVTYSGFEVLLLGMW